MTTRRQVGGSAVLLALLLGGVETAHGQSGRSWMNGIVFGDSETRGLAGATVELRGDSEAPQVKGVRLAVTSGEDGKYAFPHVPYGDYRFRVSAPGFQAYEIRLYVASDALTALHVRLQRK